jgi:hypothetical protein
MKMKGEMIFSIYLLIMERLVLRYLHGVCLCLAGFSFLQSLKGYWVKTMLRSTIASKR